MTSLTNDWLQRFEFAGIFSNNGTLNATTTLFDSGTSDDDHWWLVRVLAALLYALVGVVALVGNALFCIVIWRNEKLHCVTHMLMTNLGVANIMFITFHPPFFITKFILRHNWNVGNVLCKLCFTSNYLTATASFYFMVLVAIDRWLAIFHRQHRITKPLCLWLAVLTWALAFVVSSPYLVAAQMSHSSASPLSALDGTMPMLLRVECKLVCDDCQKALTLWSMLTQFVAPVAVMLPCYGHVARFLWRRPDVIGVHTPAKVERARRRKRKTLAILLSIVASLVVCWGPLNVSAVLFMYKRLPMSYAQPIQIIGGIAAAVSVSLTPVLYLMNDSFRDEVLRQLNCLGLFLPDANAEDGGEIGPLTHHVPQMGSKRRRRQSIDIDDETDEHRPLSQLPSDVGAEEPLNCTEDPASTSFRTLPAPTPPPLANKRKPSTQTN